MQRDPMARPLMYIAGFLLAMGAALVLGGQVAALVHCGGLLERFTPVAGIQFVFSGDSTVFGTTAEGCTPGSGQIWVWFVATVLVVSGIAAAIWMKWMNHKQSDDFLVKDIMRREGVAQPKEIKRIAGEKALLSKATTIRPSLKHVKDIDPCMVGLKLGSSWGYGVFITSEDSIVLVGPPRSGKGFYLIINAILDAPGAVVTTSTRGDNFAATAKIRATEGRPVVLFDPQSMSGMTSTLKWSPMQGCEEPQVAMRRAKVLIAASGSGKSDANQEWAQVAETILAYLLHAGALGEISTHTLGQWGVSAKVAEDAIRILESHPRATPGWALGLESELTSDPRMLPSKWMGVGNALQALMLPEVTKALNPESRAEMLDPESFIKAKGTLYLIGTKSGGGAIAPYLIALMDEMVESARALAFRSPGNRLDPPMSLILDEIANLAPWPALPQIMADGGGVGISTMVVLQSLAQARGGWGEQEAQAIFDAAIIKIQLGGAGNDRDLETFAKLMGDRQVKEISHSWSEDGAKSKSEQLRDKAVLTIAEMRRLPTGYGLYIGRNGRPILMKMSRWIDRPDAAEVHASIAAFNSDLAQQLEEELSTKERVKV